MKKMIILAILVMSSCTGNLFGVKKQHLSVREVMGRLEAKQPVLSVNLKKFNKVNKQKYFVPVHTISYDKLESLKPESCEKKQDKDEEKPRFLPSFQFRANPSFYRYRRGEALKRKKQGKSVSPFWNVIFGEEKIIRERLTGDKTFNPNLYHEQSVFYGTEEHVNSELVPRFKRLNINGTNKTGNMKDEDDEEEEGEE